VKNANADPIPVESPANKVRPNAFNSVENSIGLHPHSLKN